MREYWDRRFTAEGKIWGETPSRSALYALEMFRREGLCEVLVPGSGYGRNSRLFAEAGFQVTGVEISESAYRMAGQHVPRSCFQSSILPVSSLWLSSHSAVLSLSQCNRFSHSAYANQATSVCSDEIVIGPQYSTAK